MESDRRIAKRKPFTDLTNTHQTPFPTLPSKPPPKFRKPLADCTNNNPLRSKLSKPTQPSVSSLKPKESSSQNETSIGSNNAPNPRIEAEVSTSTPTTKLPVIGNDDLVHLETTVYTRRRNVSRTKDKGKAVSVVPFSCPPPRRLRNIGDELDKEQGDGGDSDSDSIIEGNKGVSLSKTCTLPRPKTKKRRYSLSEGNYSMPKDFVEKQRAYFAEIDAFELQEEVVSESELE